MARISTNQHESARIRRVCSCCTAILSTLVCMSVGAQPYSTIPPRPEPPANLVIPGLGEPTIDVIWTSLTARPFLPGTSELVLGQDFGNGVRELIAIEGGWGGRVGEVLIIDRYNNNEVQLVLPSVEYTDENGVTYNGFREWNLGSASAIISGDNGYQATVAGGLVDITVSVVELGESSGNPYSATVTFTTFAPLWDVNNDVSIASSAAFELSTPGLSSPVVINGADVPGSGGSTGTLGGGEGGGGTAGSSNGSGTGPLSCELKCFLSHRIMVNACQRKYRNALDDCWAWAAGAAAGGCLSGAKLCPIFNVPLIPAACCIIGGAVGGGGAYYACEANALNNLDECLASAWDSYALCMLNNCGILIAHE